jgi:hypothetical protein
MRSKNKLAICQLFHPHLHGITSESSNNIYNHFLVYEIINIEDFYNSEYILDIMNFNYIIYYNVDNSNLIINQNDHTRTVRNYDKILDYYKTYYLDIIVYDELEGGEAVGYLKTFWLKIFQRKWKSYYKKIQEDLQRKKRFKYLLKREIQGK